MLSPGLRSLTPKLQVSVTLRRSDSKTNAGFNFRYESTTGTKATGGWYTIPADDQWHTQTWTLDDAQFVGKWATHFSLDSDSTKLSQFHIKGVTVTKVD